MSTVTCSTAEFVPAVYPTLFIAVTPPGYKTLNGTTVPCEAGSYRSSWTPGAPSCSSCGSGVAADKTDRIIQYDLLTGAMAYVPVTTAPDDCCECAFVWHFSGQARTGFSRVL